MELKPGYKQTGIGVIPKDWEVKTLGEFISLRRGHDLTERDRRPGEVPVMGSAGQNGCHDKALAKSPGIVLGRSGASFGQAHFCEVDFWPHNTALYVTDFHGNNPRFVFYFLRSIDLSRHNSGGAQQSLNRNFIAPIPVALPPTLAEQETIAEALSDADALIESLEQLIAKKRQLKHGAMRELLRPKDGWVEKRLGNTAVLKARIGWQGLTTAEYLVSGDFYLVTGTDFKDGYVDWSNCHYVDGSRYKQDKNIYLLSSNVFTEFLNQLSAGSTINHLYQKDFVNFIYKTPATIVEQTAIATFLSDADAEIAALEAKLAKARQLKQGMMQELLTGKTRLVESGKLKVESEK